MKVKEMRTKSNRFALVFGLQVAFSALISFAGSQFQEPVWELACFAVAFTLPAAFNIVWYYTAWRKADSMGMHYAVIAEILFLLFVFQFLM